MRERLENIVEELYSGSKSKMAKDLDMSPQAFNNYVNDNPRTPGYSIVLKIIDLGINAHWLYTGKGPMLIKDLVDQVNDLGVEYNASDPVYINIIAAYHHLKESDLSDDRKLEIIREFQESILKEHNQAFIDRISKK